MSSKDMTDDGCICKGNWRGIVKEYEPLFNKALYRDGKRYVFQGLVWAADDLYYLLTDSEGKAILASCVGALEKEVGHGFILSSPAAAAKPCKCGNPIDRSLLPTGDKCSECVI